MPILRTYVNESIEHLIVVDVVLSLVELVGQGRYLLFFWVGKTIKTFVFAKMATG